MRKKSWLVFVLLLGVGSFAHAQEQTPGEARRVTLHYEDADPEVVFDDLARQLNLSVKYAPGLWRERKPAITLHAEDEPLVKVLASLYTQADVTPGESLGVLRSDGVWNLRPGNGARLFDGPSVLVGPSLLVARMINISGSTAPGESGSATIQLTLVHDPSDLPAGVVSSAYLSEAVDDRGESLLRRGVVDEPRIEMNQRVTISASILAPSKGARQIARLSGTIKVVRNIEHDTLGIPNLQGAAGSEHRVAGIPLTIEKVEVGNGDVQVKLRVDAKGFDTEAIDELHELFLRAGPELVDSRGKVSRAGASFEPRQDHSNPITLSYQVDRRAPSDPPHGPMMLRWTVPTLAERVSYPFVFENLPLP